MPELPEVETVKRGLELKLKDFFIDEIDIRRKSTVAFPENTEDFINGMKNSSIKKWDRRGKYLIAYLEKKSLNFSPKYNKSKFEMNGCLVIHLRMTGYFDLCKGISPPCKHTRIRFFDSNRNELRFVDVRSFGQMWWIKEGLIPGKIIKGLGSLGPEPFSAEFNIKYLKNEFKRRTKSIKAVLLDQTIIAGIGNIYADESLYEAGICPFRKANSIKHKEVIKLRGAIINVLRDSIGFGGTTFSDFRDIEGSSGNYASQAKVYRRTGKQCLKCNNLINRKKIAGRSTHWCLNCQK